MLYLSDWRYLSPERGGEKLQGGDKVFSNLTESWGPAATHTPSFLEGLRTPTPRRQFRPTCTRLAMTHVL